jgi:hypothetical protein
MLSLLLFSTGLRADSEHQCRAQPVRLRFDPPRRQGRRGVEVVRGATFDIAGTTTMQDHPPQRRSDPGPSCRTAVTPLAQVMERHSGTGDPPHPDMLAAEIEALAVLSLHDLRVRWRRMFRTPPPDRLGASLLRRILVHKLRARAMGDLDAESVRFLERIARDHEDRRKAGGIKPKAVPVVPPVQRERGHGEGTLFVREFAGEMHRVVVVRGGFEWQGAVYRSLSQIARQITGTTGNGPRFFGLRDKPERGRP